jgi:hypothetical protein
VTDHLEVAGHVIQHLGDVLAQLGHPSPGFPPACAGGTFASVALTAVGAFTGAIIGGLMHDLLTRQMIGQRLALRIGALADRTQRFSGIGLSLGLRSDFGLAGLKLLEQQFELLDLPGDAFG